MKRLLQTAWQLRFWLTLTPLGLAVLVLALWVYFEYGGAEADLLLRNAALALFFLLAVAEVATFLGMIVMRRRLRLRRDPGELELESGTRASTGFSFQRFVGWPFVQVTMSWVRPKGAIVSMERAGGKLHELVEPQNRGEHPAIVRRYLVTDIFGLVRWPIHQTTARRLRVLPARTHTTQTVISHFVGGEGISHPDGPREGELLDIRRYTPGDPLRYVLWKAFARTRQLLVRTAEQAISPSPSAIAYFVAGPADEASASAARHVVESGALGDDFLFSADGTAEPAEDVASAIDAIIHSVAYRKRGGEGLEAFLNSADSRRWRSCVLFVPPHPGPWLTHVVRAAAKINGARVVIGIDGALSARRRSFIARALFALPKTLPEGSLKGLPEVFRQLNKLGLHVSVLHRSTGELVALPQIELLLKGAH